MSVQVVSHPGHDSLKILKEEGTLDFFKFVKMFYFSSKRLFSSKNNRWRVTGV